MHKKLKQLNKFIELREYCRQNKWPRLPQWQHWIYSRHAIALECVKKVGSRYLIDLETFEKYLQNSSIDGEGYSEKISDEPKPMSIEEIVQDNFETLPAWAIVLRGFRNREGLSQKSLSDLIGTTQANISGMENGKRPIGKSLAKRFADFFKTDYRVFL